ncbi:hypothetical protein HU200_004486 [Digitaria exilis]|uniref:Protein kinase domain-containing protein n=1 Tax=Digitaria exilis TaxID=1010633 RepID=A0A835FUX8_9POAL|nr:hypothetical protein HU200_004486 [Digitaria exilis]
MSFVGTHEYLAPEIIRGGAWQRRRLVDARIFLYELLHGSTPFKGAGNRATLWQRHRAAACASPSDAVGGGPATSSVAKDLILLPGNALVTVALRASLGAMDLECVHRKVMERSDRRRSQNRLLVSCKKMARGNGEQINLPFAGVLTEAAGATPGAEDDDEQEQEEGRRRPGHVRSAGGEDGWFEREYMIGECPGDRSAYPSAVAKEDTDKGLSVKAYNRDGRLYNVQLKYLSWSATAATGSKGQIGSKFLEDNGLLDDGGARVA